MKKYILLLILLGSAFFAKNSFAQCPTANFTSTAPACSSTLVNFTNTSGNTGGGWTYYWDFDYPNGGSSSPATSTSQSPTNIDYSGGGNGTYTVAFTITNGGTGCSSTVLIDIDIRTARADFSPLVSSACVGTNIEFYNQGTLSSSPSATVTHSWSFGTGATPSSSSLTTPPLVSYSSSGMKTVTHTVSVNYGGCGGTRSDTRVQTLNISPNPVVSFSSNSPQCISSAVNFTNTGTTGSGYSYSWDFGTDATPMNSSAQNPSGIVYASSGSKTITLTIADQNCTSNGSGTISINATPTVDFTSTAPKCTGETVDFTNTGTSAGVTWLWNFGSGATPATSTSQNPTGVIYSTSGSKIVTLTTTNSTTGCAITSTKSININQTPTTTFTTSAPVCINTSVDFTNTGSTGVGITYNWDFGSDASPANSTAQSPVGIIYGASGTKTVSLTVINAFGCSALGTQNITINATPTVDFTSTAPKCTGETVDFTNTGTSAGVTWLWNFGVGASPGTSNSQNPTGIIYSIAGIKSVTLSTTNSATGCAVTTIHTINIKQTPIISFTSNTPVCAGSNVNFTNSSSNGIGITYNWDFGASAIPANSTTQNPSGVRYSTSGVKTVTLNVSNEFGCSASATASITIKSTPIATFTSTAPKCMGDTVDFNNTGTVTGVNYSWFLGTGSVPNISTAENPLGVVYSVSGIKDITLTTTDNSSGCSATTYQTITISPKPVALFTSNAPVCAGDSVNFTNSSTTGTGIYYNWDFGVDASPANSTALNPVAVAYSSSGNKTVTLIVTNESGCNTMLSQAIFIRQTPIANFTSISSNSTNCTGDSVAFLNTGTVGAIYSWNFDNGATPAFSALENPQNIVYASSGIKTAILITTLGSCTDTIKKTINVIQTPAPSFVHNAPQCEGSAVNFSYTGTVDTNWVYNWDFGVGSTPSSSSQKNPLDVTYFSGGSKTVLLTVSNGLCAEKAIRIFNINQTPVANFTSISSNSINCTGDSVDFLNTGTTGAIYSWNFGNGATPAFSALENPQNIVYATSGIKTVLLITTLGSCTDSTKNTINVIQTPAPSFVHNAPQCEGSVVNFSYTGTVDTNWVYNWDFGVGSTPSSSLQKNPQSIIYFAGGAKSVLLSVSNGFCVEKAIANFNINNLPIANAGKDTTICADRSVQIGSNSISGNTYTWFPESTLSNAAISNPVSSPIAAITGYTVTVKNTATGCVNTDYAVVTMLLPIQANAGVDVEICRNEKIQIGAALVEGQIYSWLPMNGLNSTTSPSPTSSPDTTTTYTIFVTASGCDIVTDKVTVTVHQLPIVNAGFDDTITTGAQVQLVATGGVQYEWSPHSTLSNGGIYNPIAFPTQTTTYTVTVTDVFGCKNSDAVLITVLEPAIWLPNAFTPDGDGWNDVYYVRGRGLSDFEFIIFNRWGEQIFYTKNIEQGWDGKRQITQEDLPAGAYVYYVKGKKTNEEPVEMKGLVNLIR